MSKVLRLNVSRVSKLLLAITTIALIYNTLAISRDYQDSWILEGLEIPFVLFVITYVVAFFSERNPSWMIILAITGRTMFLLIPNLKYVWFQGTAHDQTAQYALANHVYGEGHIFTEPFWVYSTTPLMHLLFSIFSIVLNVPVVDSMKYLPVLWSSIYPLLTYVIVEKMGFLQEKAVLKYALFISSVPFTMEQYLVTGTLFGILLVFLILSNLILMFQKSDRRYWFVCTILMFALAAAHSVSSTILAVFLLAIMVLQRASYFRPKSYLRASAAFAVASISVAWLMFAAGFNLQLISQGIFVAVPSGTVGPSQRIPPTFFEHLRVNTLSAIRSFSVLYGADAFFLLLTLAGLIILLKRRKQLNSAANFLLLFGWSALLFIVIGVLINLYGPRVLNFERLLFPVFSSVLVLYISKNARARTWIRPVIFLSIIVLATIELYNCQPLVPSANVLYKDLPPDVPLGYVGQVNSIYQRQMINFAETHVSGRIACPSITRNQIIGFTRTSFWVGNLLWYYPLDKSQPKQTYDYFLIHLPGKSGILSGKPWTRNPGLILEAICNSSIVYTNGESYILANNPNHEA